MRFGRLYLAAALLVVVTTSAAPEGAPLSQAERQAVVSSDAIQARGGARHPAVLRPKHEVAFGAFVGSWDNYIPNITRMSRWLDNANLQVGHTYLAGNGWNDIEGETNVLSAWSQWRQSDPSRKLVLGVPMLVPNEDHLSDGEVARLLLRANKGEFDQHFLKLAKKLVSLGGGDTIITLGWEMNGVTYTSRCRPDPAGWKAYWRRIVRVMRSVPGQHFSFDFTPNRGLDAIPWTRCYPGDDVVDIIGMDSYDQPGGGTFDEYASEPYGLQDQVEFAAKRGKQVSYPEWGLFRNGDNPQYVDRMVEWIRTHDTAYQTLTDYCPHGFWECDQNPKSAARYKQLMSGSPGVVNNSASPWAKGAAAAAGLHGRHPALGNGSGSAQTPGR